MTSLQFRNQKLYLSYCSNVHPAEDLDTVIHYLKTHTIPLREQLFPQSHLGMGLWISKKFSQELLATPSKIQSLKEFSQANKLFHFTLNGFPYGSFHQKRVKEQVFIPSWLAEERVTFLQDLAKILSQLLDSSITKGSISTLSGSFKIREHGEKVFQGMMENQIKLVQFLYELEQETGKQICVALEPEPLNSLETTEEVVYYFKEYLFAKGGPILEKALGKKGEELISRYLGICYDTCHQACQFENLKESLLTLKREGISIHKVQLSNALHLEKPSENQAGIEQLKEFQEEVYLHQVMGKKAGEVERAIDLEDFFRHIFPQNEAYWKEMEAWRVHFHVPLFHPGTAHLQTTQKDLQEAIQTLLAEELTQHFEIETYTWDVLPAEELSQLRKTLVDGLAQEFQYVLDSFAANQVKVSGR